MLIEISADMTPAYVLAETLGRAGHRFASWEVERRTWATHFGDYSDSLIEAAARLAERAGL